MRVITVRMWGIVDEKRRDCKGAILYVKAVAIVELFFKSLQRLPREHFFEHDNSRTDD